MNIQHISAFSDVEFLVDLCESALKSDKDLDVSILLDADKAKYFLNLLEQSSKVITGDFVENDFGSITGICLVTLIKDDEGISVIVEDFAYMANGEVLLKNHEVDTLFLLEGHAQIDFDLMLEAYATNKTIFVSFNEKESISALL